jgi:aldehyde:ferredoxin oxidoreductase
MGVHYSIHATGADHTTGVSVRAPLDSDSARTIYDKGFSSQLVNYLGLCKFVPWNTKEITDAVQCITGWQMDDNELMAAVQRGITLARIFNLREGFTINDDVLPERFESAPSDSPLEGIDSKIFVETQKKYYHLLGWDETGIPTKERLKELDIGWAAEYLT